MGLAVSVRTAIGGAQIDLAVLAVADGTCYGVDLDSGALVRAGMTADDDPTRLRPFDIARGALADPDPDADPTRPDAVDLVGPMRPVGRLDRRRAERLLRPLRHPDGMPILGFGAAAIEYWRLEGDRPSMAIVESSRAALAGSVVRFSWMGNLTELPAASQLRAPPGTPRRLLVALTSPHQGWCGKQVVALLP